jgi:hypothetical protein
VKLHGKLKERKKPLEPPTLDVGRKGIFPTAVSHPLSHIKFSNLAFFGPPRFIVKAELVGGV